MASPEVLFVHIRISAIPVSQCSSITSYLIQAQLGGLLVEAVEVSKKQYSFDIRKASSERRVSTACNAIKVEEEQLKTLRGIYNVIVTYVQSGPTKVMGQSASETLAALVSSPA